MDTYNSPSEYANDYGTANGDYNDLIDIDRRQSDSNGSESRFGSIPFPTTPTDDRRSYSSTKYYMANGYSGSSHEQRRGDMNFHNPEMSVMHASPTKGSKTGLTRYIEA